MVGVRSTCIFYRKTIFKRLIMKVTLEQLAEKIDSINTRLDKLETKVDDVTSTINKSKGVIGFLAWGTGIFAVIYSLWK